MNARIAAPRENKSIIRTTRPVLQRAASGSGCANCPVGTESQAEDKRLHRKANDNAHAPGSVPPIVRQVLNGGGGRPLDMATRSFFEPRFGMDFSAVRVHTDAQAAESARAVHALAYTVGHDIVFNAGQYVPHTPTGQKLMAHELTHVVQQANSPADIQTYSVVEQDHPTEREAESVAQAVLTGTSPRVTQHATGASLHRHKDDLVAYSGGQSGYLRVFNAKKLAYTANAVSGHPGHGENEPSVGPIPTSTYLLHPGITQPTVSKLQGGTCGADGIGAGYQEITSTDQSPCTGAHYCNVSCPTTADPARTCFTPQDCWGPMRIKIEGSKAVVTPEGKRVTRDGFFIHGGNPKDAVSSGCVKSLDNGVFAEIRKLTGVKGAVPLCVGTDCPAWVGTAVVESAVEAVGGALKSAAEAVESFLPF